MTKKTKNGDNKKVDSFVSEGLNCALNQYFVLS